MHLFVQQHAFSIEQKTDVFDDNDNILFRLKCDLFTLGREMHVYDSHNNEVGYLKQNSFALLPEYELFDDGEVSFGTLRKAFTLVSPAYDLDSLGWKIKGDSFSHNYEIYCLDEVIATIDKQWHTISDCYDMNIKYSRDVIPVLLICMAIDADLDRKEGLKVTIGS